MPPIKGQAVGINHKRSLYLVVGFLWLTGMIWLYFQYVAQARDEFGLQTNPNQILALKIHGALGMAFLIVLGSIIYHMIPGWQQKRQRLSGASLVTICTILILSGWGLYYLGEEHWRHWASLIHSVLGVLLPAFILFHVWNAQKLKKSKSHLL